MYQVDKIYKCFFEHAKAVVILSLTGHFTRGSDILGNEQKK